MGIVPSVAGVAAYAADAFAGSDTCKLCKLFLVLKFPYRHVSRRHGLASAVGDVLTPQSKMSRPRPWTCILRSLDCIPRACTLLSPDPLLAE
jgi:hypothetical protein